MTELSIAPQMRAATASWAIYGAAKEWVYTPNRCSSEAVVETVTALVAPILNPFKPEGSSLSR